MHNVNCETGTRDRVETVAQVWTQAKAQAQAQVQSPCPTTQSNLTPKTEPEREPQL